jgi:hypothetical protein
LEVLNRFAAWWLARPTHTKALLAFAVTVVTIELLFRRFGPKSPAYRKWTAFFEAIGHVWTSVLLAAVYFLSVSLVAGFMKLFRRDPLDRALRPESSFWRAHEPNPLGPLAAARHQF